MILGSATRKCACRVCADFPLGVPGLQQSNSSCNQFTACFCRLKLEKCGIKCRPFVICVIQPAKIFLPIFPMWWTFPSMNITDELERLARLRKDGTLSDEEFAQAKKKVLAQPIETATEEDNRLLARAVNRYVWLQTLMALVGIVIFLVF